MNTYSKDRSLFRILTASALFDGHDVSINIFRRLFQQQGVEVIHMGHNRSVHQLVTAAIQEDVDALCISSYQGAHMEFFRHLRDLLNDRGGSHIAIFGGGGGTILPHEIETLEAYGITRLYHAEDGRKLGLKGIVKDAISRMHKVHEKRIYYEELIEKIRVGHPLSDRELAKAITFTEVKGIYPQLHAPFEAAIKVSIKQRPAIIGVTGSGGAGKSSLIDELILRYLSATPSGRVGVLAFDPTKKVTGGALLGDRIRMNSVYNNRVFLRSMATHSSGDELSPSVNEALALMKRSRFDLIILETTGIGQGNSRIADVADLSLYVTTSDYGASMQLEKIDMIDLADIIVLNKFDKLGAQAALEDLQHAYAGAHHLRLDSENRAEIPVIATTSSDFNDPGVTRLLTTILEQLKAKGLLGTSGNQELDLSHLKELKNLHHFTIIPPERTFYLGEIAATARKYRDHTKKMAAEASNLYRKNIPEDNLSGQIQDLISKYRKQTEAYSQDELTYDVRGKLYHRPLIYTSLSDLPIPKIALPRLREWGDIITFMRQENFPGFFPYTAGVFPLKNTEEDPKRQFAGEGPPERTNKRFHYLSKNDKAKRLSTAFDPVTLYGEDPSYSLDVYGNIGNSGVSIATLDDMKDLYAGFDLSDPLTSVSLTINGPAPIILAMFFNAAIDFEIEKSSGASRDTLSHEQYEKIKTHVLKVIRGTVQADILKEEQAQNECIFSSKFALKMMGDVQEYFIKHNVKNFYSASISGYHIAEAGANPITQLAFTLANGFTIVEYYLSRGMSIDSFAPQLSFFFSCGLDPEYTVMGRVARRLWSVILKERYGADDRSCKFKYHVQTSGRSLHAQEIHFNDIRTTLEATLALLDHCNSLHTNAYDEAITTPTEESERQAMAIQLILTKELGLAKCENALQGSYFIEHLTNLVEEAVLKEFESISRRGGVLGAMEKQFQRHTIQAESMKYEMMKSDGQLPIVGVNTFVAEGHPPDYTHLNVVRATEKEKNHQIVQTEKFIKRAGQKNIEALKRLKVVALSGENIFEELMETVKYCSLGQITHLLYSCGGEYRRSM